MKVGDLVFPHDYLKEYNWGSKQFLTGIGMVASIKKDSLKRTAYVTIEWCHFTDYPWEDCYSLEDAKKFIEYYRTTRDILFEGKDKV